MPDFSKLNRTRSHIRGSWSHLSSTSSQLSSPVSPSSGVVWTACGSPSAPMGGGGGGDGTAAGSCARLQNRHALAARPTCKPVGPPLAARLAGVFASRRRSFCSGQTEARTVSAVTCHLPALPRPTRAWAAEGEESVGCPHILNTLQRSVVLRSLRRPLCVSRKWIRKAAAAVTPLLDTTSHREPNYHTCGQPAHETAATMRKGRRSRHRAAHTHGTILTEMNATASAPPDTAAQPTAACTMTAAMDSSDSSPGC
jgi:hypothetical protein